MKTRTNKLLALLLVAIMCIGLLPGYAMAADANVALGTAEGKAGDEVTVDLTFSNNPGIASLIVEVGYDDAKVTLTKATANVWSKAFTEPNYALNPVKLSWADFVTGNQTDNGVYVTLTFKIKDDAEAGDVTLTANVVGENTLNEDYDEVPVTATNGKITIKEAPIPSTFKEWKWAADYSTADAIFTNAKGDTPVAATVTSKTTDPTCTEDGKITYTATVNYDADLDGTEETYTDTQEVAGAAATGHTYGAPEWTWADDCSTATAAFKCEKGDDTQTVNATITSATTDPTFEAEGKTVYTATVTFEGTDYTDTKEVAIPKLEPGTITVNKVEGEVGQEVEITLTMDKNPGIVAGKFEVAYDAAVVALKSVKDEGVLKGTFVESETIDVNPYVLYWSDGAATEDNTATGVIATLTFEIIAEGESDIKVTYDAENVFNKAMTNVPFDVTAGLISTKHVHKYGEPTWTWADDATSATAEFKCEKDDDTQTVDATLTEEVTVEATTEAEGEKVVTATVTFEGVEYTDKKTVAIPQLSSGTPIRPSTPAPTPGTPADELPFIDVDKDDWFYDDVKGVYDEGIMNGTSETTFSPFSNSERAMIVTMLYRLEGSPEVELTDKFTDVEDDTYYAKAVAWAVEVGVAKGVSEDLFAPHRNVTREQLAAFVYRYAQYKGIGFEGAWAFLLDFADADSVSDYAYEPMCWCVMNDLIKGVDGATLAPQGAANRAQIAVVFNRLVKLLAK